LDTYTNADLDTYTNADLDTYTNADLDTYTNTHLDTYTAFDRRSMSRIVYRCIFSSRIDVGSNGYIVSGY